MKRLIRVVVGITFCMVQPLYAMQLTAVGAGGQSGAIFNPSTGFTSSSQSYQYGGGLLLGFKMVPALMTELGLLYLPRGFVQTFTGANPIETTFTTVQFPLLLRYSLVPSFSIGLGMYFSHGFGFVYGVDVTAPGTVNTQNYGASYAADDYGAVLSVALKMSLLPFLGLTVDGRYMTGLVNMSKISGLTTFLNDFQLMAGIQFGR